jgi:hypothetical protein
MQGNQTSTDIYLLHDDTLDIGSLAGLAPERQLIGLQWRQRSTPPASARVLLYLSDDQVRDLSPLMIERQWEIGVLPHPEARPAIYP